MLEKVIIGTAAMGRLNSKSAIISFIDECINAGFTTFDTAPLYGSGLMESMLATALEKNTSKKNITVNTKFGLTPTLSLPFLDQAYLCKKSVLAAAKRITGARASHGKRESLMDAANESIQHSARLFPKGQIDVLFAHEIPIEELMCTSFLNLIQDFKSNGHFKRFGLGGYRHQYSAIGNEEFWKCVDVIQVESKPGIPAPRPPGWNGSVFVHGVLSELNKQTAVAANTNLVSARIEEALYVQRADKVAVGISRTSHLIELGEALAGINHK